MEVPVLSGKRHIVQTMLDLVYNPECDKQVRETLIEQIKTMLSKDIAESPKSKEDPKEEPEDSDSDDDSEVLEKAVTLPAEVALKAPTDAFWTSRPKNITNGVTKKNK